MFYWDIIARYVLPIIYDSFVVLVLVLLVLFVFRIKDSNIRILFFFLPLIKPFIIILERININDLYGISPSGAAGIRFPDPTNIIKIDNTPVKLASDPNYLIMTIIIAMILILLLIRWINIAIFYRRLAFEDRVGRKEIPDVFKTIDSFTERTKIKIPDVSLTHRNYFSPFIVGIRRSILVLSPRLLDELSPEEKDIIIKHELSHIKRKDNLIGWIALILRDLSFFNPFAYVAYYLIRGEQERAADKLILKYSDSSPMDIAKNILNSILKLKKLVISNSMFLPAEGSPFSPAGFLSYKRLDNRVSAIIKTDSVRISMRITTRILMYLLFILLLLIQVVYAIKIGGMTVYFR